MTAATGSSPVGSPLIDDVLDPTMIAALRNFGPAPGRLIAAMCCDFLAEVPALVGVIERAGGAGESAGTEAARAAHCLRGVAGHLGAVRLASAAGQLEAASSAGEVQRAEVAVRAIRSEATRAVAAVLLLRY